MLQGYLLGYCYRQKVVQETRAQYQQLVSEIQQDNITTSASARETVVWPSQLTLCYPAFKGSTSQANVPLLISSFSPEVSNQDPLCVEKMEGGKEVFKNLPEDRESLIELRSKLGMELVWLRQAISSRQKVQNINLLVAIQ